MSDSGASKIYTRGGDKGKTSLIGGARVSKSHLRLEAYGTIDELNSWLGVLLTEFDLEVAASASSLLEAKELQQQLTTIQNDLFNVGSQLACEDPAMRTQLPGVTLEKVKELEAWMDFFSANLKPLKNFILPGGSKAAAFGHVARTVCRRAERVIVTLSEAGDGEVDALVVQYVNRLSDYLFVLSRHLNRLLSVEEPIWGAKKN